MTTAVKKPSVIGHDILLITTMAVLAACGLIYEYLLSHYAGRVLGVMESAIYSMIGLMIVSMGLGAFAARQVKCPFNGLVWLEFTIALLGCSAILIIGGFIGFSQVLPQVLTDTFGLPPDALLRGGLFKSLSWFALKTPYLFGFILGFFIGMEIPLIAKIREHIHQKHLANNLGTIYGADYVGAGIGAAIWVTLLLAIDISKASALTAFLNLVAGAVFITCYWQKIKWRKTLISMHGLLIIMLFFIYQHGNNWLNQMSNLLYLDHVVYNEKTRYQQVSITERQMGLSQAPIFNLYLNGRLQFSSADEQIYHSYLVTPAMAISARHDSILIIGGGDGLALRDVLKWSPQKVTLIDLDEQLISIFREPQRYLSASLATRVSELNQHSLSDKRVEFMYADAFIAVNELLEKNRYFDTIIVDLPDPSHPDLNKLYSVTFYAKLQQLLASDGALAVQSTSPYHAKSAFISIGKTIVQAGYENVAQYHDNVPSFGEWGWTIATKRGASPLQRLTALSTLPAFEPWLTLPLIKASFEFSQNYFESAAKIPINYLGSHTIYQLHQNAWQNQQGLNDAHYTN